MRAQVQLLEQPSLFEPLPSSQSSPLSRVPSPHMLLPPVVPVSLSPSPPVDSVEASVVPVDASVVSVDPSVVPVDASVVASVVPVEASVSSPSPELVTSVPVSPSPPELAEASLRTV